MQHTRFATLLSTALLVCISACGARGDATPVAATGSGLNPPVTGNSNTVVPTGSGGGTSQGGSQGGTGTPSGGDGNTTTTTTGDGNTTTTTTGDGNTTTTTTGDGNTTTTGNANACIVTPAAELLVTRISVVDDPVRASWSGGTTDPNDGAWAFGGVLARLAPTQPASAVAGSFLRYLVDDDAFIQKNWPQDNNTFTVTGSPIVLLAIVNRLDLRNPAAGILGEVRFVYATPIVPGFEAQTGKVIVEVVVSQASYTVASWAAAWHALADPNLTADAYSAGLQALTDYALSHAQSFRLRTANESVNTAWTFRQFGPDGSGLLAPAPLSFTPDARFDLASPDDPNSWLGGPIPPNDNFENDPEIINPNDRVALLNFVAQISTQIPTGTYSIPDQFAGAPFAAVSFQIPGGYRQEGGVPLVDEVWSIPSVDPRTAAIFGFNTCNGCHGIGNLPGGQPIQIFARSVGQEAGFGPFLKGTTDGRFNDLLRRQQDMTNVLCHGGASVAGNQVVIPNF